MGQADTGSTFVAAPILDILKRERARALSPREWKFRLAGYGYAIRDVEGMQIVTNLASGADLGMVPAQLV